MEFELICEWCGLPFLSNQPHTRFCSDKCAKLYSKQRYRQMGIDALEAKICAQTSDTLRDNLRSKYVLSTSEAAKYLGVCRTTVSRYLALGMLPAVQLPGKNLFRKTDLDKILNLETGVTRLKGEVSGIDTDTSNLTTIDRASKYYGASAVTMLKILNDRGILPIVFAGINYFKKDDIRRIFGSSPLKDTVKTQQWVTHEQIELEYRMTYTAVTRLLRELKIPSKRVNRVTYYSMDHLKARKKEMDAAFSELYYTVPQINEKYHLYDCKVYKLLEKYHVKHFKNGKTVKIVKEQFDKIFAIPEFVL